MRRPNESATLPSRLRQILEAGWFVPFIASVIVLAAVLVGLSTVPSLVERHGRLFEVLEGFILTVFVVEILVRLGALWPRPLRFFRDGWNLFDFGIVTVCLLPAGGGFLSIIRLFRLLRVLRLISVLPRLQVLVGAMLRSVPSMGYVALLLTLLFYVYGVTGVFLFRENDPENWGDLGRALMTMFEVVTLEGWVDLLDAQMAPGGDGTGVPLAVVAPVFFVSFIFIGTMVVMNLVIGVVIGSMDEAHREMADLALEKDTARRGRDGREARVAELKRRLRDIAQELDRLK